MQGIKDQNNELVERIKAENDIIQVKVLDRQQKLEDHFQAVEQMAKHYSAIVEDLHEMFKRDYVEFVRDRKRWKSDFDIAISNAQNNFN